MKIIRFTVNNLIYYGELHGNEIEAISGDIFGSFKKNGQIFKLSGVTLLSPVDPGKVICIGLNYIDHAKEKGRDIPEEPMIFMVSPTAIISHETKIILPNDHLTEFEAELVVVIKKECKNVSDKEALSYVLGYTIGNDISDRVLQNRDKQFTRAKSFDTFKPLGPWIETNLDPENLNIQLTLNGEIKQKSNTNMMIFGVNRLISEISQVMALLPGDIVFTGTPDRVSSIKSGDVMEISIDGIGTLRNSVM